VVKAFFNPYSHGFARLAVATPRVRVGDSDYNLEATHALMREAARGKALLAVFPELGLSAYSCEDLFHQQALLRASEAALTWLLARSKAMLPIPGTASVAHLEENVRAAQITLSPADLAALD